MDGNDFTNKSKSSKLFEWRTNKAKDSLNHYIPNL